METFNIPPAPFRTPRTHDYSGTNKQRGHDCEFVMFNGGWTGRGAVWGEGIRENDYLVLDAGHGVKANYRVVEVAYSSRIEGMALVVIEFEPDGHRVTDRVTGSVEVVDAVRAVEASQ